VPPRIRTHNPSKRATDDPRLRPRGHWDRQFVVTYLPLILSAIVSTFCQTAHVFVLPTR
jgi:hypothetical protein